MKQIFDGIKDILNEFFSEGSTYNYVNGNQFVIDTENDFIYGMNFPKEINIATPSYSPQKRSTPTAPQNDFTRIFFKPKSTVYITNTQTESAVEGKEYQVLVQNANEYVAKFDLILYTKSPNDTFVMNAFNFQELFFNVFRGNVPFLDYLFVKKVWDFGWEGYDVRDLSFVENTHGVSRYEASFSARYIQQTNSYILDKLQKIKIDELKIF
jgi:hypothetical protein